MRPKAMSLATWVIPMSVAIVETWTCRFLQANATKGDKNVPVALTKMPRNVDAKPRKPNRNLSGPPIPSCGVHITTRMKTAKIPCKIAEGSVTKICAPAYAPTQAPIANGAMSDFLTWGHIIRVLLMLAPSCTTVCIGIRIAIGKKKVIIASNKRPPAVPVTVPKNVVKAAASVRVAKSNRFTLGMPKKFSTKGTLLWRPHSK